MVDFSLLLPHKSAVPAYALHIVSDDEADAQEAAGKRCWSKLSATPLLLKKTQH